MTDLSKMKTDIQLMQVFGVIKTDYSEKVKIKMVWKGLSESVLEEILRRMILLLREA